MKAYQHPIQQDHSTTRLMLKASVDGEMDKGVVGVILDGVLRAVTTMKWRPVETVGGGTIQAAGELARIMDGELPKIMGGKLAMGMDGEAAGTIREVGKTLNRETTGTLDGVLRTLEVLLSLQTLQ